MLCNSNMNNDVGEGLRMYVNNIMTIFIVFRLIQMNSTTWWLFGMVNMINLADLVYGWWSIAIIMHVWSMKMLALYGVMLQEE